MSVLSQTEINERFRILAEQEHLLPIKITQFYQRKIDDEVAALGHTGGPLHRSAYPSVERLEVRAPGEVADFVEDRQNMPEGLRDLVVHKYENRLLFLPTDICSAHCQYCFRQDVLSHMHVQDVATVPFADKVHSLIDYLRANSKVTEVILSGGDPMTIGFGRLDQILKTVTQQTQVTNFRIHTRTIVFSPRVWSDKVISLLSDHNVRIVFHIIHPYEVCDEVKQCISRIQARGIRCYNQFPLLRKVNDHAEVLQRHLTQLDELGIRNLSMFIPDAIHFSAPFRIRLRRLFDIVDQLNWTGPSWVNSTRLVMDTPVGKVRREDMASYDEQGIVTFVREGKQIEYHDFPEELDEPGDLNTLLWKD